MKINANDVLAAEQSDTENDGELETSSDDERLKDVLTQLEELRERWVRIHSEGEPQYILYAMGVAAGLLVAIEEIQGPGAAAGQETTDA